MISYEQALTANEFHCGPCVATRGPRGGVHVKIEAWRRNGKTKTWKTRPGQFQIPVKHGLYNYAYITQDDAHCHVASECPAVDQYGQVRENPGYQPKTGQRCTCRPGVERDNCPVCEGTGQRIDFAAIRALSKDFGGSGLGKLRGEAEDAAHWRGHRLKWHPPTHGERKSVQYAECVNDGCKAWVQVNMRPAPNEIDIGGSAVALDCPVRSDEDSPLPNPCGTGYLANAGAKLRAPVHDYASAERFLGSKTERTLANNTVLRYDWRDPDSKGIQVVLHSTPIVTFYPDGNVMLNSSGYHTTTTKARINEVILPLGYRVSQQNYNWFLYNWQTKDSVDFFDGMVIRGVGV